MNSSTTPPRVRSVISLAGGASCRAHPKALADLNELAGPLPQTPTDPAAVLALLDDIGSPATVATAGSTFLRLRDRRITAGDSSCRLVGRGMGSARFFI
jgi:hypothetical protein